MPALIETLGDKDGAVRASAASELNKIGKPPENAVPALIAVLRDRNAAVRSGAALALGQVGEPARTAVPALIQALRDKDRWVRRSVASALGRIGEPAKVAVPALTRALGDKGAWVRVYAADALDEIDAALGGRASALKKAEPLPRLEEMGPPTVESTTPFQHEIVADSQDVTALMKPLRDEKGRADLQSRIARSHQLAAQALISLDDHPDLALLLSVEANRIEKTLLARSVLLTCLEARRHLDTFLHGHIDQVNTVVFSPDGKILALGSGTPGWAASEKDNTVRLWDVTTGQPLGLPLKGHTNAVVSLAFTPDGKVLASGSADKTIILWDVATHQLLGLPLKGHTGSVFSVAFSPKGKILASGSCGGYNVEGTCDEGEIYLWDVRTRQRIRRPLIGHTSAVYTLAFSPDGKTLASGSGGAIFFRSDSDYSIILWDVAAGQPLASPFKGHIDEVRSVAFSPDGKTLASGSSDTTIMLWDVPKRRPLGELLALRFNREPFDPLHTIGHMGGVLSVAFSLDGETLASADSNNNIILWEVANGYALGPPLQGDIREVTECGFQP